MNTFKILLVSAALAASGQVFAQGIYFGPDDVGASSGMAHHRDYHDGGYRDHGDQEGRSVYQPDDRPRAGHER